MKKLTANIVTENDAFFGTIEFDQSIQSIKRLSELKVGEDTVYPGFIDLHVHGGGGCDIMEGEAAIRTMLKTHAAHGTTSLLITTVTETQDKLEQVFNSIAAVMKTPHSSEAQILGVHLEGPFLSDMKLGAQPSLTRPFDLAEIKKLHAIAPIKVITLAPESGVSEADIKELSKLEICIQLGHSNSTYEESAPLIKEHVQSVTHLFNAMSGMHHRTPGLVGATLAHATSAELIPDLIHVHPGAIQVALRAIPNLYFVTDATAASGMPDGDYKLGPHTVHKCANGVRLSDGTLAGSSLTMDQALKNAIKLGLSIVECSKKLSTIQASLIHASDRGQIKKYLRADLVVLSKDNDVSCVYINGQKI